MNWGLVSDIVFISSFAVLMVFALLGFCQLVSRKSLKKVDKTLLAFFVPLILMVIIYFVFNDLFIVSVRPDGSGEASFPSTHVLVTSTIFFCVMFALPRYLNSKIAYIIFDFLMIFLIVLVSLGRIFSNKHWPADVFASLGFSLLLATIYYLIIRKKKNG